MTARDANHATWFMLRYPRDFAPRAGDPTGPALDDTLLYDDDRHVLELLPRPLARERVPLPHPARDVTGETYEADPATSQVVVGRCDGTNARLVCEPNVFADPKGLAIDARGLLYVADPRARRVVVLRIEDGTVKAILHAAEMVAPVDVTIGLDACIYVADHEGGAVFVFSSSFRLLHRFEARNGEGLPEEPRPVAITTARDGAVVVFDANHPRLLRFSRSGEPEADVLFALARRRLEREGPPDPCESTMKTPRMLRVQHRLAALHRETRLDALITSRSFETSGVFLSEILNGRLPRTTWHRIGIGAEMPEGTSITIETAVAEDPADFADPALVWSAPTRRGAVVPFTPQVTSQLVQSPPGRYIRLRVTLTSNGTATPRLRWIQALYPRVTYADSLPAVFRREPESALFLERFLALFEQALTGIEDRYDLFVRQLDPAGAPAGILEWLACLVDLAFDPGWPLDRRRALLLRILELYRIRGTPEGIATYVEIFTGTRPLVRERFLERPREPALLGRPGGALGTGMELHKTLGDRPAEEALFGLYAHRFSVYVYLDDECDEERLLPVVDRIVEVNKPAHTDHDLVAVHPDARVGAQSTVGVDLVLGGRDPLGTRIGGAPDERTALGVDTVLGAPWPRHDRDTERQL